MRCKTFQICVVFIVLNLFDFTKTLPVTSKALENNSEQLIWQSSWYSQDDVRGEEANNSPFKQRDGKKAKKITAKSIFIIPSFEQSNAPKCNEGFKLDEKGNCIRIVSINQGRLNFHTKKKLQ
jgi:hypothetical protein